MRSFLLAGAAAVALVPGVAWAQDSAGSDDPQSSAAEDTRGLAEIIVTAQRREESAQRAAVAINVIGGSDVTEAGVTQVAALGSLVPALTVQQIGGSTSTFIRGVGNFSVSITSDPAVAFNYDGVYVGRINSINNTFFDLARIEVLKGPQGTLYGRNATAGVINIIPQQPKPGEFSGYGTASYGNYNALALEGAVNVPLGEDGAVRISGAFTDRDGYLSNGVSDDKTHALRVQFKVQPTPDLTIRLAADYTHLGGNGPGFSYLQRQVRNFVTGAFTVTPTNIPRSQSFLSPASQAFFTALGAGALPNARATRNPFPDIFRNNEFYGINAEITYDTGAGVLTLIPSVRFDQITQRNPAGGFPINNDQKDFQYSLEARFAGKAGMFDYTLGFFYFDEEVRLRSGALTFGNSISFTDPSNIDTQSYAPFARVTANLTDSLRLVGGIRYTHDAKQIDSTNYSVSVGCSIPFTCTTTTLPPSVVYPSQLPFAIPGPGQTIRPAVPTPNTATITRSTTVVFRNSRNAQKVTYRGAVEYDVAPASLLFASFETGYRSGGFNTSVGFETYEPETITAYTVGSKNRFLDNRLQLNVEAFYWKYRNQQVAHPGFDFSVPPRPNSIIENLGRSTIKGFEVEAVGRVTSTTTLSADVQYLDTENKFFTYRVPAALASLTGCPSTIAAGFVTVNCAGFPAFNAPKWTVNLSAEQRVPVGEYEFVLGADTQYKSKRFMGFEYQPGQLQSSSWTTNAQIAFGPSDDRWSISGFVRNIENDRLLAVPFAFAGLLVAYTTPPRTYGVRGSVKF